MTSDSTGTFAVAGAPDLPYSLVFGGDSSIATSASYVDPTVGTDIDHVAVDRPARLDRHLWRHLHDDARRQA